ncbi:MAG: hypothetical protein N838_21640 [Thiohalocapsa sp. PB-PSB1]|nr:MAG: hypothetical protein N838_21640 [Thiohalocapsa sp. PB-PSB1]
MFGAGHDHCLKMIRHDPAWALPDATSAKSEPTTNQR